MRRVAEEADEHSVTGLLVALLAVGHGRGVRARHALWKPTKDSMNYPYSLLCCFQSAASNNGRNARDIGTDIDIDLRIGFRRVFANNWKQQ
jgi:hypothetical protein